ncbi:methylenetetrahydrofolate--tRNA-(uracil(54)-C(5))-methyltransferase (FADH(2)-oxidizing) TrmFO [Deferribacter thermophilus]|uniref:methylenetetrahydrofolate--tRNA-(uracil(54)- C(5))-methyltransferase (FADH(2)-oxidizing) TrmFO n=1 Tax=Deferribacter thermophilus TaxID=53573 RepID=UPI003C217380
MDKRVTIIGGGLAGSELAFQLAESGIKVVLYEMRPKKMTEAHETGFLGELLCSNSLKAESLDTASGLLKAEMEMLNSLIIKVAKKNRVPAGNALAVDREKFAREITNILENHENIKVIREEVKSLPKDRPLVVASGPLTSQSLSKELKNLFGGELYFYDAISPIVDAESIDYSKCFFKSRYNKGESDYLNCPMTEEEFDRFYDALMKAEKVEFRDFEKGAVFEGCMPIEELAARGKQTLLFGPMRPVGLEHPETGEKYYAVVQLRKEDVEGRAYNIVGFQTKMKIGAQKEVFRLIPGLENAEFLRYGSIHRNTYVRACDYLDAFFRYKNDLLFFAGQITGVEGYIESAATSLIIAKFLVNYFNGKNIKPFPETTALGALSRYVSTNKKDYVPSNFHFGMLPSLDKKIRDKKKKKLEMSNRALKDLKEYLESEA